VLLQISGLKKFLNSNDLKLISALLTFIVLHPSLSLMYETNNLFECINASKTLVALKSLLIFLAFNSFLFENNSDLSI